jgi:hypothetical protein
MNLVPISKYINTYINMDYILTVSSSIDNKEHYVTTIDGKEYQVSKDSYETILKYGKAKI